MSVKKWNYSSLAKYYDFRADYNQIFIKNILKKYKKTNKVLEIGSGTGKLTKILLTHFRKLTLVEPNQQMIKVFKKNLTKYNKKIELFKISGEDIDFENNSFDLVFFGSSFNVLDRKKIFKKLNYVLKPGGTVIILWNNRIFNDKLQKNIESIIKHNIKNYKYGLRRSDLKKILIKSKIFKSVKFYSSKFKFKIKKEHFIDAWKSHGTLFNQTSIKNFIQIITQIKKYIMNYNTMSYVNVPYITKVWICKKK